GECPAGRSGATWRDRPPIRFRGLVNPGAVNDSSKRQHDPRGRGLALCRRSTEAESCRARGLMTAAIETAGLSKCYGAHVALEDLTLQVPQGTLLGFLGPNGAGKTTTIRILIGLLRASAGSARLFGRDCWSEGPRVRAEIGYLPGELHLYETL